MHELSPFGAGAQHSVKKKKKKRYWLPIVRSNTHDPAFQFSLNEFYV